MLMLRHCVRNAVSGLLVGILAPVAAASQTSVADSALGLNRTGMWDAAYELSAKFLAREGLSSQQACPVRVSLLYSAIRLKRVLVAESALQLANKECAGNAAMENQLKALTKDMQQSLPAPIEAITIHPLHEELFTCVEHRGDTMELGDRYGADCMIVRRDPVVGAMMPFRGSGADNQDWYGWGAPLLAPFDATIGEVSHNATVNKVGTLNPTLPSSVVFVRADGVRVLYAHLGSVSVKAGEHVTAGQRIGTVGNNGRSYSPHTHVGAWRGKTALQIAFDLRVPVR
jgi:murein DD-endopeptidase MepM/ murein hydrolase activator NlpD